MSTILDALRKAQRKEGDADAAQREYVAPTQSSPPPPPFAEEPSGPSETFDDARPNVSSRLSKRSAPAATVALAVVGLAVGIGSAQIWLGNWSLPIVGTGEQVAAVTPSAPAENDDTANNTRPTVPSEKGKRTREGHGASKQSAEGAATENDATATPPVAAQPAAPAADPGGAPNHMPAAPPTPLDAAPPSAMAPGLHMAGVPPALPPATPKSPQIYGGRVPPPGTLPAAVPPASPRATGAVTPPPVGPGSAAPARNLVNPVPGIPPSAHTGAGIPNAGIPPVMPGAPPGPPAAMVLGNAVSPTGPLEAPQTGLAQAPPTGAPEVSLLFIQYSRDIARRVASLRGPGGKLLLVHEGDKVEGMEVASIRADAIELDWNGTRFLLLAAR